MNIKPGYATSEAWVAIASVILSALLMMGVISPTDKQTLEESVTKAIVGVFVVIANAGVVIQYIRSRTSLKKGTTE